MADATANLPEEEKNLQALLRSLKACLIRTRERAEKIACLDFDGYQDSLEDEFVAQAAFDDDVDHAEEVLAWRATVVADLVGAALSIYARAHSPLDDPWMAWRREPPSEPAAGFVHGLNEDVFFCARVAYHAHSDLDIRRTFSVPSDGDIEDIPGYLEAEQAWTWREWLDVLGTPQEAGRLGLATAAAKRDLAEGHARHDVGVEVRFAELADQVTAFQMPIIERLERIGAQVDALGAPNRFKAEEFLMGALGVAAYSSLSDDARTAALDSERRFRDLGTLDWNSVVSELAKAFEIQVRQRFVPSLAQYLKQREVLEFPKDETIPNQNSTRDPIKMWPIIKGGKAVPKLTMGTISIALASTRSELEEFGQSSGINLSALKKLIDEVNLDRTRGAHEVGMTVAEASKLRGDWLGVATRDGGIFGALLPKRG